MKTTFKFIIATMAAISVFASCQKEMNIETANNTNDAVRVISAQFDNSTKATLNDFTPSFVEGDSIMVSNAEQSEVCTISAAGTFTTTLLGTLTAIYPAAAAVLSLDTDNAPIATSNDIKVPALQDGDVAKAIIAKAADITAESTSATFNVKTALFQITPPSGVKSFTITSLKPVEEGVARTGIAEAINTTGESDADKLVITVSNNDSTTFYVALVPGVNLSDLSFDAGETYGMKGIPVSKISTDKTAANTKYTIDKENWHPYVKIGDKKWATENIGATLTNPYGTYFSWADTTGHELKESPVGKTGTINSAFDYDFSWANCPFGDGSTSKFKKYVPSGQSTYLATGFSGDTKTVLDLDDDAAYVNWGGAWRMPTGGTGTELGDKTADFTALANACKSGGYLEGSFNHSPVTAEPTTQGVYYYNVDGGKGLYFVDKDGNNLFFPAAGYGNGTSLNSAGSYGYYWSSTLHSSNPGDAYSLYFGSSGVDPQSNINRCNGRSVRPVSDL